MLNVLVFFVFSKLITTFFHGRLSTVPVTFQNYKFLRLKTLVRYTCPQISIKKKIVFDKLFSSIYPQKVDRTISIQWYASEPKILLKNDHFRKLSKLTWDVAKFYGTSSPENLTIYIANHLPKAIWRENENTKYIKTLLQKIQK